MAAFHRCIAFSTYLFRVLPVTLGHFEDSFQSRAGSNFIQAFEISENASQPCSVPPPIRVRIVPCLHILVGAKTKSHELCAHQLDNLQSNLTNKLGVNISQPHCQVIYVVQHYGKRRQVLSAIDHS